MKTIHHCPPSFLNTFIYGKQVINSVSHFFCKGSLNSEKKLFNVYFSFRMRVVSKDFLPSASSHFA